jgi:uncharacterized DUF497 family protein
MKFEWDETKNDLNIAKHGISFEQAKKIFHGFTIDTVDHRFEYGEERVISLGMINGIAVLVVIHTDREDRCRIILARQANRKERDRYDEEIRKAFDA